MFDKAFLVIPVVSTMSLMPSERFAINSLNRLCSIVTSPFILVAAAYSNQLHQYVLQSISEQLAN